MKDLINDFKELFVMEISSPAAVYNYDFILRYAGRFLSERIGISLTDNKLWRLDGSMIQAFVNDFGSRGVAGSTKIQYIRRMNRFFSWAHEMGCTKRIGASKKKEIIIPVSEKMDLPLNEAAAYFNIGIRIDF